jgi:hypothetical protein
VIVPLQLRLGFASNPQTWPILDRRVQPDGIESPADLKGKRVGVAEYQQTAALYSVEQGLTPRRIRLEEIFAASTMEE